MEIPRNRKLWDRWCEHVRQTLAAHGATRIADCAYAGREDLLYSLHQLGTMKVEVGHCVNFFTPHDVTVHYRHDALPRWVMPGATLGQDLTVPEQIAYWKKLDLRRTFPTWGLREIACFVRCLDFSPLKSHDRT
jgi:hypothetical protein